MAAFQDRPCVNVSAYGCNQPGLMPKEVRERLQSGQHSLMIVSSPSVVGKASSGWIVGNLFGQRHGIVIQSSDDNRAGIGEDYVEIGTAHNPVIPGQVSHLPMHSCFDPLKVCIQTRAWMSRCNSQHRKAERLGVLSKPAHDTMSIVK